MTVRPLIKRVQGMKKNWEYNVARDWSTINYCKRLTKSLADTSILGDDGHASGLFDSFQKLYETNSFNKQSNEVVKMFHAYKSRDNVVETVTTNQPFSFVCLGRHTYVACYSRSQGGVVEYTGVCLSLTINRCCPQSKAYYWDISIDNDNMSRTFKATNICQFCVGLPISTSQAASVRTYYIITSNWEELVMEGNTPTFDSPANKTCMDNYL
jgi:hypothetical protein